MYYLEATRTPGLNNVVFENMMKLNTTSSYKKFGFRLFNVHAWSVETEDFRKRWVGVTFAGFSVDVSLIYNEAK